MTLEFKMIKNYVNQVIDNGGYHYFTLVIFVIFFKLLSREELETI